LILPLAYVRPGTGFAFLGSFLSLFLSVLASATSLFLWPFRALRRAFLRRKTSARARVKRVVFLGLDGLDPRIAERLMDQGKLPILGRHRISSTILRVPVTFPPDEFAGRQLSAMPVPDLLGTQGTYSFLTTRPAAGTGNTYPLTRRNSSSHARLPGPAGPFRQNHPQLTLPFTLTPAGPSWTLKISGGAYSLRPNEYSPWVHLRVHNGPTPAVHGLARFLLRLDASGPTLYVTPIQIDPEHPALPISHPRPYSIYLPKLLGSYATAGLAEETWAMNHGILDEDAFLAQAYSIQREREAMFFAALDRTCSGALARVFDTSDRVQHMFFRHMDGRAAPSRHRDTIERMYQDMDRLPGETMRRIGPDTALFVLSDHGFLPFRRGINLNSWLHCHGYLALSPGLTEGYRASWDGAKGRVTSRIFEDNGKAWSGDHRVDPALVPGVLFSNLPIEAGEPGIEDMAPTALHLLGVPRPQWMDGQSVIRYA
jgi:hypothetical protein